MRRCSAAAPAAGAPLLVEQDHPPLRILIHHTHDRPARVGAGGDTPRREAHQRRTHSLDDMHRAAELAAGLVEPDAQVDLCALLEGRRGRWRCRCEGARGCCSLVTLEGCLIEPRGCRGGPADTALPIELAERVGGLQPDRFLLGSPGRGFLALIGFLGGVLRARRRRLGRGRTSLAARVLAGFGAAEPALPRRSPVRARRASRVPPNPAARSRGALAFGRTHHRLGLGGLHDGPWR